MTEWFKVADCKSVRFSYRRFESYFFHKFLYFSKYNAVGSVPVLGTGSHVFKSHYFEFLINFNVLIFKKLSKVFLNLYILFL